MPRGSYSVEIEASCDAVFDVVHDYERRLAWDSMLREARLVGGAKAAGMGVRSVCVGTWKGAFQALETEYIQFERGRVAAVKLTNHPAFFRNFAATIKHDALGAHRSRVTYIYSGQTYQTVMREHPGRTLPVFVEVRPQSDYVADYRDRD